MAKKNPAETDLPNVKNKEKEKHVNMLSFLNGSIAQKWEEVEEKFHKQVDDGNLFKDKFGACIGLDEESKNFGDELFDVLAKRKKIEGEKGISLQQLKEFWEELKKDDLDTRVQIFFDLCDKNDDNKISKEEVETILKWTVSANKLTNIKDIESYASLILKELDPDGNGFIEFEHMELIIKELWNSEEAKMLQSQTETKASSFLKETKENIIDNWKQIWVSTLWAAINLSLFAWKLIENKNKEEEFNNKLMGYCIGVAKGSAETLKFNMAVILFLVCRGTLTKLRSTFLSSIFPFDDHISFHMVVGSAISVATLVHMVMHLGCGFPMLLLSKSLRNNRPNHEILGPNFEEISYSDLVFGSVPGVTGILMVIIMAYSFTLAIPKLRRNKKNLRDSYVLQYLIGFNAFWYAHHLLFLVYVLLIFHGYFKSLAWDWFNRTTWMYIAFPLLLYASEGLGIIFNERKYNSVNIKKVIVYSENALVALYLEKPDGFKYESGMYLFVKCPDISKFEWHPFSITSAPGDDYLSLHIQKAGDWTEELINRFEKEKQACEHEEKRKRGGIIRQESKGSGSRRCNNEKYPQIYIKGAYGAPAQDYIKYDILLLIGLGVGATPMISILKDVLNHIKKLGKNSAPIDDSTRKVSRAYFYWVTRTQESFEWFKGVMNDVGEYDENGKIIEMHNHLSCVQREGDARSVFLTILQNVQKEHDSRNPDIISGSRIRARYGRPDWKKVFSELKTKHEGSKIGVFYCGGPNLSKTLRNLCKIHSLGSTKFHFHKENF